MKPLEGGVCLFFAYNDSLKLSEQNGAIFGSHRMQLLTDREGISLLEAVQEES